MKKISVVIPCFNSANTISGVVDEIVKVLNMTEEYDYEIILVSDGSPDNVFEIIKEIANNNKKVIGIELTKNFGQHAAIIAGFKNASGDILVASDDDGQTPIEQILELVNKVEEGFDVVYARYPQIKQSLFRKIGSKINDIMLQSMLSKPKNTSINSYFACNHIMINEVCKYNGPYPYIPGLLLRATKRVGNVDVKHRERIEGKSNYNIRKLISLWLNGFTAFSVKPLRIATVLGFVVAIIGFISTIYVVINKIFINPEVPIGYSSIISIVLFTSGAIMFILGFIGEYIGRIYIRLNASPQYIIREKVEKQLMPDGSAEKLFGYD